MASSDHATTPSKKSKRSSKAILYGDEDAKAKAKAALGPTLSSPGVADVAEDGMVTPRQTPKRSFTVPMSLDYDDGIERTEKSSRRDRKHSSRRSTDSTTSVLYGGEDEKSKAKAASSSSRSVLASPGVADVSEDGMVTPRGKSKRSSKVVLYDGDDGDEKAKAKAASSRSMFSSPGVVSVSEDGISTPRTKSSRSVSSTLYGDDDEKAKLKAASPRVSKPGIVSMKDGGDRRSSRSPRTSKSPRSSRRTKTIRRSKARSSSSRSSNESSRSAEVLYGTDEDAKAKARASGGKATAPGVERIDESAAPKPCDKGYVADPLFATNCSNNNEKPRSSKSIKNGAGGIVLSENGVPKSKDDATKDMEMFATAAMDDAEESEDDMMVMEDKEKTFEAKKKEKPTSQRKGFLIVFICLLILIAAGIGAYFALRKDDASATGIQNANLEDQTVELPSDGPSQNPTTSLPSSSPSFTQLYDPPSPEDCLKISKNETILGEDTYQESDFGINLDVTLQQGGDISEATVQVLMDAIQEKLLPKIAGCDQVVSRRRKLKATTAYSAANRRGATHHQRQLSIGGSRFVILNAFVTGNEDPDAVCIIEGSENPAQCHRVVVELTVFLKGVIKFIDIVNLIGDEVPYGTNLVLPLDLNVPFIDVKMVGVDILTSTAAPSKMPTVTPSDSPSDMPSSTPSTSTPSSMPTRFPTFMPFPGSTPRPTPLPTLAPTRQPSSLPSLQPTVGPTVSSSLSPTLVSVSGPTMPPSLEPLSGPTFSSSPSLAPVAGGPSSSLTTAPVTTPTLAPVVGATPPLTKAPTLAPVVGPTPPPTTAPPTKVPTLAPVVGPTLPPTPLPTKAPTKAPTPPPTTPPTKFPTWAPVVGPTLPPTPFPTKPPTKPPTKAPTKAPTKSPTKAPTKSPTKAPTPLPTKLPTKPPTKAPTAQPSPAPTPAPTPRPTAAPSASPSIVPTQNCFCTAANYCDATITGFRISCNACEANGACTSLTQSTERSATLSIGEGGCAGKNSCNGATIHTIGPAACSGDTSCAGRHLNAGKGSCSGKFSCSTQGNGNMAISGSDSGLLTIGAGSCTEQYSCFSYKGNVENNSCTGVGSCGGRSTLQIGVGSCLGEQSCSGRTRTTGNNLEFPNPAKSITVADNSCQCEQCCMCMTVVNVAGTCNTPGSCCMENNPTQYSNTLTRTADLY